MTVPPERGWRTRAGIRVCAAGLPAEHVTVSAGLTMTSAARTVVDLARTGGFWDGLVAADSALRKKLTTKDEMRAVIGALRHWPGIRRAAEVVEFADRRSESALESIARAVIRDLGLPPPDLQVRLGYWEVPGLPAEPIARVDFYWKEYRTVAEVDGDLKYKDPARAKDQLRRDIELRAAGFEVVHFDWRDITRAPDRVAAVIRDLVQGFYVFDAAEAVAAGFLNRTVPASDLAAAVDELVGQLTGKSALTLTATKRHTNAVTESMVGTVRAWNDADSLVTALRDPESRAAGAAYLQGLGR